MSSARSVKHQRGYSTVGGGSCSDEDTPESDPDSCVYGEDSADRTQLLESSSVHVVQSGSASAVPNTRCLGQRRYELSLLATTAGAIGYAQRAVLAVSIVRLQSVFGWDKVLQGQILSSFFLGYMVCQLPGGLLAAKFGARRVLGLAILMSSVCSLLSVWAARRSPSALFGVRLAQGCFQAPIFPACSTLWSHWAPPAERSTLSSNTQVGGYVGSMLAGVAAGWQCDNPAVPLVGGWEAVFVLHGFLGVCWSLLWFVIWDAQNSPREDIRRCTDSERDYIEAELLAETQRTQTLAASVGADGTLQEQETVAFSPNNARESGVSWKLARNMARSPAVWAICIAHTSTDWVFYVMGDGTPAFLRDVVGLSLTQAGFFNALPQLLLIVFSLCSARVADHLIGPNGRCFQRTGLVRKAFTAAALLPAAAGLLLLGVGPPLSEGKILVILTLLSGVGGIETGGGYSINHLDIAPVK